MDRPSSTAQWPIFSFSRPSSVSPPPLTGVAIGSWRPMGVSSPLETLASRVDPRSGSLARSTPPFRTRLNAAHCGDRPFARRTWLLPGRQRRWSLRVRGCHLRGSCPGIGGGSSSGIAAVMTDGSGNGYWVVGYSGEVHAFGDATNYGGPAADLPYATVVRSAIRTASGRGYWIFLSDGTPTVWRCAVPWQSVWPRRVLEPHFGDLRHLGWQRVLGQYHQWSGVCLRRRPV